MAMTLRLSDTHNDMTERLATQLQCSKHEAILRAIEMADERMTVKKTAIERARYILETRDKELMERLADA